ncbi:hypothetical protein BSL78_01038 [Apostichopus japonicus]|uniref:Uncharacterized protein n=1 Tax=Stichopus japonicus TaxID=307972 RepID=A0A2G8LP61_STIJA|nr:hypothetical protein BSL78_01038 [Apostichopus japonicus]
MESDAIAMDSSWSKEDTTEGTFVHDLNKCFVSDLRRRTGKWETETMHRLEVTEGSRSLDAPVGTKTGKSPSKGCGFPQERESIVRITSRGFLPLDFQRERIEVFLDESTKEEDEHDHVMKDFCSKIENKPVTNLEIAAESEAASKANVEFIKADVGRSSVDDDIDLADDRIDEHVLLSDQNACRPTTYCILSHFLILTTLILTFFAKFAMVIFPDFALSCDALRPLWSAYFEMFFSDMDKLSRVTYPHGPPPL